MAEGCNHNCSSCGESCSSRTAPQSLLETPHEGTKIKHIIAVISGKGGVVKIIRNDISCSYLESSWL